MRFYSQFGEDRFIYDQLRLPRFGTFIEVGAFDGVLCSNTMFLEEMGWKGMVIEPDPIMASRCHDTRKCTIVQAAAGSWDGTGTFSVNKSDRGMSGLDRPGEPMAMAVYRLETLMNINGIGSVDVLSVDTEGTELDVWEGIGQCRPTIVIMEFWTQPNPPVADKILARMAKDGYRERHRTTANLILTR